MNQDPLRMLQSALEANHGHEGRHVQLATRDTDGHPACRTIVFRHLEVDAHCLYFITDFRSHKAVELRRDPRAEACWYLHATREQFRLRGEARLVGETAEPTRAALRQAIWERLMPASRRLFAAPAPGTPSEPGTTTPPAPADPPDCFALLELTVQGVDYLDLTTDPHRRSLFHRQNRHWLAQALNP